MQELSQSPTTALPSVLNPEFYARHFEQSLDLLCIAEIHGYFIDVNPAWTTTLGWSKDELLSRPVLDFIYPADRETTLAAREKLATGTPITQLQNRYRCKDGSYRWLSWRSSLAADGATVFAVARDIEKRRQADLLRQSLDKLDSHQTLTGGFAHDFNNLLASISMNLEVLQKKGPLNVAQIEYFKRAKASLRAAGELTHELIDLTYFPPAEVPACDLRPLLQSAIDKTRCQSNASVQLSVFESLWLARVTPADFEKLLHHLLTNAIEASGDRAELSCSACNHYLPNDTSIESPSAGAYVALTVTDSGPGIPEPIRLKVFDAYFSTKPRGERKGQGLGLTVCRAIVQRHHGHITLDSDPSTGTTVRCYFPADPSSIDQSAPACSDHE